MAAPFREHQAGWPRHHLSMFAGVRRSQASVPHGSDRLKTTCIFANSAAPESGAASLPMTVPRTPSRQTAAGCLTCRTANPDMHLAYLAKSAKSRALAESGTTEEGCSGAPPDRIKYRIRTCRPQAHSCVRLLSLSSVTRIQQFRSIAPCMLISDGPVPCMSCPGRTCEHEESSAHGVSGDPPATRGAVRLRFELTSDLGLWGLWDLGLCQDHADVDRSSLLSN
jgi:hypothetical protein